MLHFAAAANAEILRGRVASLRGDHERAVEIADRVVAWLRPLEIRPYDPAALLLKGTSLLERGKLDEAERTLLEGRAEAERLGFDPILWQIEMAAQRHRGSNRRRGARGRASERGQRAIIDRIAASIDDARASVELPRPAGRRGRQRELTTQSGPGGAVASHG